LWFSALALAVAGPLLGGGYLLLLDYPAGPEFPRVPLFPLPSSGDVGNGTPFLAIQALLRAIHQYLPDKVLLIAPIVLGGVGLYRLVHSRFGVGTAAAAYGGTLYVINPFVADRYLAGHMFILFAMGLLPWALGSVLDLLDDPSGGTSVRVGAWLLGLAAVDLHVAGFYALLVVMSGVAALSRRGAIRAVVGLALGVALCAYWVLPSVFVPPGHGIGQDDLAVYATDETGSEVIPTLAGLYGFWRDEFTGPAERNPALHLLLTPILGLALIGAMHVLGSRQHRRAGVVVAATALIALVLAAGTSFPPTAGAFRWVYDHVAPFRIYREPQKFLTLVVMGYAIFGAVGIQAVVRRTGQNAQVHAFAGASLAIMIVLAYAHTMLWGFWGQVHLSRYPADWARAERIMEAEGAGGVLVLPWHLYAVMSFSGGRIVANPSESFFSREVIAGDNVGFGRIPTQSSDPFSGWVEEILAHRADVRELGHLVAPLDIRFVVLLAEADRERYRFLGRQTDLTSLYRGPDLELFENRAWRGPVLGLQPASAQGASLFADGSAVVATQRLLPLVPLGSMAEASFPAVARILPGWRWIGPGQTEYVATAGRCTDGWRLGEEEPICHLGAVTAFRRPQDRDTLWRPLAGARVLGSLVSALSVIGALVYVRYSRRSRPSQGGP
jgi:hypothetical protein